MKSIIASALLITAFAGAASAMTPGFENLTDAERQQVLTIIHSGDSEGEKNAALQRFAR